MCAGICAIVWIANGIWIAQAVKQRFTAEIYVHTGLGIFFSLLTLELTIGYRDAWMHFDFPLLAVIGWLLFIPAAVLVIYPIIQLQLKGKPETYDFSYSTTFLDTGMYKIIRQPITLGIAIWSVALILIFQSALSFILGIIVIFFSRMSAIKEADYNIKKFGEVYKKYINRVPMWNLFKGIKALF
jgi:protein-S-isoprenylcysteine O-methyltransferase Ste14